MYKLIAIDLDGTLLNSYGAISIKNKETIKKVEETGTEIVIASGRPIDSIKTIANEIDSKNYFIAGLHGLGNWGAAWYIDRKYSDLDQFTDNQYDNIQILLEVTYQDGRISDVRSISDITQKEIDEMISAKNVVNVIKKYKDIT